LYIIIYIKNKVNVMSAVFCVSLNQNKTSTATYIQTSPGTPVNVSNTTVANLGLSYATSPWSTTATSSLNLSSIGATISSNGIITATTSCRLRIVVGMCLGVGTSAGSIVFYSLVPMSSTYEAKYSQTNGVTYPRDLQFGTTGTSTNTSQVPTLRGDFIAKAGDQFGIAFGGSTAIVMSNALITLTTEPIII
jgi:hypothetical protein